MSSELGNLIRSYGMIKLATELDMSYSMMVSVSNGTRQFDPTKVKKVAKILRCSRKLIRPDIY